MPRRAERRVLIVDDDQDFAGSLAALLEMEGYVIAVAHDGAGAKARVEAMATEAPGVALVDIRLGREDGVALATELGRIRPDLLVVMVTAYASVPTAIRALQAGAYDYVCKPFDPDDLLATLGRCFDRHALAHERAQAEELLRRSRRLEAIGRLSAGIAHDFNNLLAVVGGNLKLLQEEVLRDPPGDRAVMRELVADALGAVEEGIAASRQLLAVGRAQPLLPRLVDIAPVLDQVVHHAGAVVGPGIALHREAAPQPCAAVVDVRQLEASLLNLLLNARDALEGHGVIHLGAELRELAPGAPELLEDMPAGAYVALVVEDDGCGMAPDVVERAFHPFFSTKPAESGSGLGLATVYGFARQSGGNLIIESEPDAGTRVTLLLPAATRGA